MRHPMKSSALSAFTILSLSACGGGGGGVGDPVVDNGIPGDLPLDQSILVSHASVEDGQDPELGASVIRIVDQDNIVVSVGGQVYELQRASPNRFEGDPGEPLTVLYLPDGSTSGEHAGLFRFLTETNDLQVSQLVGVADAFGAIPDAGSATFTGRAHTYRTNSFGTTTYDDDWDVEVTANFQVQGVGATMTNGSRTLEMDPAGIQNNGGTAYFEETLISTENDPFYVVSNGTMSGLFYGGGQEVGGRFSYDLTTVGTNVSVAGVFHAD